MPGESSCPFQFLQTAVELGLHRPVSLPQHVVSGTCLQGGLHRSMSLPQHVVSGTCLQGGLHRSMSLPQHVVSGTCLQDSRIKTKETFSSEVHRLLGTDGVLTSLTLLFWRWLTVSPVLAGRSARTSYLFIYLFPSLPPPPFPLFPVLRILVVSVGVKHRVYSNVCATTERVRGRGWPKAGTKYGGHSFFYRNIRRTMHYKKSC